MAKKSEEELELEQEAINESIAGRKEFLETFNKMDSDQDGYISFKEFELGLKDLLIHVHAKNTKEGFNKYSSKKNYLDLEGFIASIFYVYPEYHYIWQSLQSQLPPFITLEPDLTIYQIQNNLTNKNGKDWKLKNKTIRICISMNVASNIKNNDKLSIFHALMNCAINKNEDNEVRRYLYILYI